MKNKTLFILISGMVWLLLSFTSWTVSQTDTPISNTDNQVTIASVSNEKTILNSYYELHQILMEIRFLPDDSLNMVIVKLKRLTTTLPKRIEEIQNQLKTMTIDANLAVFIKFCLTNHVNLLNKEKQSLEWLMGSINLSQPDKEQIKLLLGHMIELFVMYQALEELIWLDELKWLKHRYQWSVS